VGDSTVARSYSLAINSARPNQLFITAGSGSGTAVFRSDDYGATWTKFNEGLEGTRPGVLCVDPISERVFVGTPIGIFVRDLVTSVDAESRERAGFALGAYPNPFNASATIRYRLVSRSHVTLAVFNTLGQLVATIVQEEQEAGNHEAVFDARNLASGVYLYRLATDQHVLARKLLILR
jgi:hypothetical protein